MNGKMKGQDISRRNFVSTVGLIGLAGLCPVSAVADELTGDRGSEKTILKTGPYLQTLQPDSIIIRWITNTRCVSWVEYGTQPGALNTKAEALSSFGLIEANTRVHAIPVDGLIAGRRYYYRICSREIKKINSNDVVFGDTYTGSTLTFETPDPDKESVSFLVFNDIHDRPESFAHLMQFAGADKKDFVLLNGDMFNHQSDEDQLVKHLFRPLQSLFPEPVPLVFSRGNHETRGVFARNIADYFDGNEQKFYFSFQCGPVYAIVLDSGEDKEDNHKEYSGLVDFDRYREQQAKWLEQEVQKKAFRRAKYKIVFSHIPLYQSGTWHGTMHCRKLWGPILNKANIDLLISGHTHRYGIHRRSAGEHNYPIVIGGGPKNGLRTIIRVKADQRAFNLEMLDDKGKIVGTVIL